MRDGRLRTAGVAVVALAVALLVWHPWRGEEGDEAPSGIARTAPRPEAVPTLEGAGVRRADAASASTAPSDAAGEPSADRRRGRVRLPGEGASAAGIAWLTFQSGPDAPVEVLGRAEIAADGTYAFGPTAEPSSTEGTLRINASVSGYDSQSVEVEDATDVALPDVTLDAGFELRGQIVTPGGRPVPDLPLRLAWTDDDDSTSLQELDVGHELSLAPVTFARVRTDAAGRFVLHTSLWPRPRDSHLRRPRFLSESREWFVEDYPFADDVLPRGPIVLLVARPALVLTARVTEARTLEEVAVFEGHAHWAAGVSSYVAFSGRKGRLELCWPRMWGEDEEARVDLSIDAPGFAPHQGHVLFRRGQRTADVEVVLTPVGGEVAHVILDVVDSEGRPFDGPWWARIVDPLDDTKTLKDLGLLERQAQGTYAFDAPAGSWSLLLQPNDQIGFLRWTETVDLKPGDNSLRCAMPAHGTLHLTWAADRASRLLVVTPGAGGTGSAVVLEAGQTEYLSSWCKEGDWDVGFVEPGQRRTVSVRVRRGEQTDVALP